MSQHLPQDHARVERNILVFVSSQCGEKDFTLAGNIFHRRPAGADLASKKVVEYLDNVLARFEVKSGDMGDEIVQEVCAVRFLCQLGK